jgi:hypothetical protein
MDQDERDIVWRGNIIRVSALTRVQGSIADRPRPEQRISCRLQPPFLSKLERWPIPMGQSRRMWDAGHYRRFQFPHGMRLIQLTVQTEPILCSWFSPSDARREHGQRLLCGSAASSDRSRADCYLGGLRGMR